MPPKKQRCFDEGKVGVREPRQLCEPMCEHCQMLWDEQRFDRIQEKRYWLGFPCLAAPSRQPPAATPTTPGDGARPHRVPRRFHDSPGRIGPLRADGERNLSKRSAEASTPGVAASTEAEQLIIADLADFPWLDETNEDTEAGVYEIAQVALAEHLLQIPKQRKSKDVYEQADQSVRWVMDELRLSNSLERLVQFRRAIAKAGRATITSVIAQFHEHLELADGQSMAMRAFFENMRTQFEDSPELTLTLLQPGYEVVRSGVVSKLRKKLAAARAQLKQGSITASDVLEGFMAQRKQRAGGGWGDEYKYIMQDIKAIAPELGDETLAEMIMMSNLMMLYSLTGCSGVPTAVERKELAEAAANLTPSASTWREVPIYFHGLSIERLKEEISYMPVVFVMNDHGHRGGKDRLVIQFAGWSTKHNRPIVLTIDNGVVGKTGAATAEAVFHHLQELGANCGGTMTDNAASAIDTQATELVQLLQGKWLAIGGCGLHSHNLTLEGPFGKVFGGSVLGEPSVLCLIRTISWLQQHYGDLEAVIAATDPERFDWPKEHIDRSDPRWRSCKELRELLPAVIGDDGTKYLKDGLMGDPTWTYDESAVVYTADSPAAMCAIM